jgi:hypothetical protein
MVNGSGWDITVGHARACAIFFSAEKKPTGPIENFDEVQKVNDTPFNRNRPIRSELYVPNAFLI